MNTLQKCIDELKKEQPDIRYILGMLETFLEFNNTESKTENKYSFRVNSGTVNPDGTFTSKVTEKPIVEEMTPEEKEYYAKMAGGTIAPMHDGTGN